MRLLLLGGVSLVVAVAWVLVPRADADVIAPYVVVFEDGVDAKAKVAELEKAHAFRADHTYVSSITGFAAKLARRQRDAIARDPAVVSVHEDKALRLAPPTRSTLRLASSTDPQTSAIRRSPMPRL